MKKYRDYRNYTDEDIIKYSEEVTSMRQLLVKLGLKPAGGNYVILKRNLHRLGLDNLHWMGRAWNKNQRLKDWTEYKKTSTLKPHLIKKNGYICCKCKLTEWNGNPIPLEVHHKDGNNMNNEYDNLELLCCNCHAGTETWRSKNIEYN